MRKSSQKEDSLMKITSDKVPRLVYTIKLLIENFVWSIKSKDDFSNTIKQLKLNSKKMTLDERNILINLLKIEHKTVADIMIPRSDISAIKVTIDLEELRNNIKTKIPHTRTLIYDGTLDNIIGFIHIKDLFKALLTQQNFQLKKLIRTHIISAPSMKLIDLLAKMRRDRTHIAIIIDEYGGTDGMVTIEDIMEAIVGRIDDEHDKKSDRDNFEIINNTTIISNARVEVEMLEGIIGQELKKDEDEFDTIGGLILAKVGNVPEIGANIDISEYIEIEVIDATPRSLKQVKLKLKNGLVVPEDKMRIYH